MSDNAPLTTDTMMEVVGRLAALIQRGEVVGVAFAVVLADGRTWQHHTFIGSAAVPNGQLLHGAVHSVASRINAELESQAMTTLARCDA